MARSIFALLVACLLAFGATGCASLTGGGSESSATPVISRILSSGELRVGMSGNQPPLNATSRSGEIFGMEPDLARVLASSMGVEAKLVRTPFPKLLDALGAGDVDLVMSGMTITPERNLHYAFIGPYFISGKSILTKSKTLAQADEAADINTPSVRLAALAGSTSQRFVEVFAPKATLVTTDDYDEAVRMVREDEVDAVVADYPICVLSAMRYPIDGLVTLVSPLTVEPIGVAMPANDPLFMNLVENYLNAVQATGTLDRLRARWFEDGSWVRQLP
jgi:polar amino acid transport system substrate-binding protein